MVHFYFDFISPYGYLAAERIETLAADYGRDVEWHAMLLGISVINIMGLKPLLDTPLKGEYVVKDIHRLAKLYDIPLIIPEHGQPNPLPAARAFYWVKEHAPQHLADFTLRVYRDQWRNGYDISQPDLLANQVQAIGLSGDKLKSALETTLLKQALKKQVDASLKAGVFGSPTFVVDGQMIWGCDRLWMLEHWLKHGCWSAST